MASAKNVLVEGLKLPSVERAGVARELIASLDGPANADEDVDEAWLAEAERRQRDAANEPAAFEDWTDVRARIAQRLRAARP